MKLVQLRMQLLVLFVQILIIFYKQILLGFALLGQRLTFGDGNGLMGRWRGRVLRLRASGSFLGLGLLIGRLDWCDVSLFLTLRLLLVAVVLVDTQSGSGRFQQVHFDSDVFLNLLG
jgi:hypothetical protein